MIAYVDLPIADIEAIRKMAPGPECDSGLSAFTTAVRRGWTDAVFCSYIKSQEGATSDCSLERIATHRTWLLNNVPAYAEAVAEIQASKVRAKFKCLTSADGNVQMSPVYGDSPENKAFFNATPGGSIMLNVMNPAASAHFIPGADYYVDFTRA